MESVAQASLPASSDFGGETPLRKRRAGSASSVLGASLPFSTEVRMSEFKVVGMSFSLLVLLDE